MEQQSTMENLVELNLFNGIYKDKNILITGNTGFKGTWLSLWLEKMGANVLGVSLENNYEESQIKLLGLNLETKFIDINCYEKLNEVISKFKPKIVFHLAAQPIVKMANENPIETFQTNVMGTLNLFESCRKNKIKHIVNVTSDKVYKNNETRKIFTESDVIGGNDLYSASKASVEIMTESYLKVFDSPSQLIIANVRSGNVIGGGDWGNFRLIPDIIKCYLNNKVLDIRSPKAVRPWQHVLSTISGYLLVGEKILSQQLEKGVNFNFGPLEDEVYTVEEVIKEFKKRWHDLNVNFSKTSFYESKHLMIDSSKAREILKWQSIWDFNKSIQMTIEWYDSYINNNEVKSYEQLIEFIITAQKNEISWTLK